MAKDLKIMFSIYDDRDYLNNVIVPLTLGYQKVIYFHRDKISENRKYATIDVLNKHDIDAYFVKLEKGEQQILDTFDKYQEADIDVSTNRYLTLYIFEKAINSKRKIYYYDSHENIVKDYRLHIPVKETTASLTIKELIELGGGKLEQNMHALPNMENKEDVEAVKNIVYSSINKYTKFVNYVSYIAQLISKANGTIHLNAYERDKVVLNGIYSIMNRNGVLWLREDVLMIKNRYFRKLLTNAGAWLETYLYITFVESGLFDECAMSSIINFKKREDIYPITCEIDLMLLKDNYLLFISCKSNKVDTPALNEIKLHNYFFGNRISNAMVCTVEDLNIKNPTVYQKAIELGVAVIDFTAIQRKTVAEETLALINNDYEYERIGE